MFDIDYLLALQRFREATDDVLSPFLMGVSDFVIGNFTILLMVFIYLCVNKRWGYFMLANIFGAGAFNNLMKNTFCVYRPWVRDAAVMPYGNATQTATGYSFPSGHTQLATSIYGSIAMIFKKHKWVVALCAIIVVLVGFSRNYLGVHTPQDVVVGLIEGLLMLWVTDRVFKWIDNNPEKDVYILIVGVAGCVLFMLYSIFKPYPIDYDGFGNIIVDPEKMKIDSFFYGGAIFGIVTGWFVERRFIKFNTDAKWWRKVLRFLIAAILIVFVFNKLLKPELIILFGKQWGNLVSTTILMWIATIVMPLIAKKV